jgi:hypothetical protein
MAATVHATSNLFILGSLVVCQFGMAMLFQLQFFSHVATAPDAGLVGSPAPAPSITPAPAL